MGHVSDIIDDKGRKVLDIDGSATVLDAVTKMVEGNVGSLLVTEGGRLAGIVTERDYLRRVTLEGRDERTTPVREIMTSELVVVSPDTTIEECMAVMTARRIRHLPVLADDRAGSSAWSRSATSSSSSRRNRASRSSSSPTTSRDNRTAAPLARAR